MDNDIDALLLQQFSSMATQDRDVLIAQFKSFLGSNQYLNDAGCEFFLDMNNWNLQDAICSYFEYQSETPVSRLPRMTVVTNGEDDGLGQTPIMSTPLLQFTKTFHLANAGDEAWPPGCSLRFLTGSHLTNADRVLVDNLPPGVSALVPLEVTSPAETGLYKAQWRMSTVTGTFFGEILWLIVQVIDDMTPFIENTSSVSSATDFVTSPSTANVPFQTLIQPNELLESEQQADIMDI